MSVEIAQAVRPLPCHYGKDHDRFIINEAANVVGVFDGADTAWASNIAQETFDEMTVNPDFTIQSAFEDIQARLLPRGLSRVRPGREHGLTTAAALHFPLQDGRMVERFGAAGDSPIISYDHRRAELEFQHVGDEDIKRRITDAFLGDRMARQYMRFGGAVIESTKTYLVGSDGLIDPMFMRTPRDGLAALGEIIADESLSAEEAVQAVLAAAMHAQDRTKVFDDITAVVIRVKPNQTKPSQTEALHSS